MAWFLDRAWAQSRSSGAASSFDTPLSKAIEELSELMSS
jgi:hypothetical protein